MNAGRHALLTVAEMYRADAAAIAGGISGETLMERAGLAVAQAMARRWSCRPVEVLCGPGNNGGDGFVVARHLAAWGWPVRLALLGDRARLRGDAALHAARWEGAVESLGPAVLDGASLVVDALFGAGLSKPVGGVAADVLRAVAERSLPVVAVDVPSGVHGDTGALHGHAIPAALTVTFFRRKPGHLLLPGRGLCGPVEVADIGIPERVLDEIRPAQHANAPALWLDALPRPGADSHKYARGHALVWGGETTTGAARLAARGAQRIGAGLVTIAAPSPAIPIYAAAMPGVLLKPVDSDAGFDGVLADERKNAVLIGPGAGTGAHTRARVLSALRGRRATVLDADALTAFAGQRKPLLDALAGAEAVLTPHEGEFKRLFDTQGDKLARARAAAKLSEAVVLLKGADTVIAAPDGTAIINENAPPSLATAGSGDVLAGFILGLRTQHVPALQAAAAAAWLHGAAASAFMAGEGPGAGLIAEDLPECLPSILNRLARQA